jgi:hypothetical protein
MCRPHGRVNRPGVKSPARPPAPAPCRPRLARGRPGAHCHICSSSGLMGTSATTRGGHNAVHRSRRGRRRSHDAVDAGRRSRAARWARRPGCADGRGAQLVNGPIAHRSWFRRQRCQRRRRHRPALCGGSGRAVDLSPTGPAWRRPPPANRSSTRSRRAGRDTSRSRKPRSISNPSPDEVPFDPAGSSSHIVEIRLAIPLGTDRR